MADDFIEATKEYWANRGLDYSADALVNNFAIHSRQKRADALDAYDVKLRDYGEVPFSEPAMRRAAEMAELRERLGRVHHALLREGK